MVESLDFIEFTVVFMVALIAFMVVLTVRVKALRYLKDSWYASHFRA